MSELVFLFIIETMVCVYYNGCEMPTYATDEAAGADLLACISGDIEIKPLQRVLVPTGLTIALPVGYEAQLRPRSGLALKHGITLLNSPGTVDSDYRGEIKVLLVNLSAEVFIVTNQMRIAQLVVAPVVKARFIYSKELASTARGLGGFGSTGA